jgi:hypothetical protein
MTAYRGLNAASRTSAFQASYSTGRVKAVLSALGPQESASSFGAETRELLGWIRDAEGNEPWVAGFLGNVEREVAVSEAGISEDEMAQKQATREARRAPARGWGGTTTPRFSGLIASEKARWTRRANSAIPIMARYAQRHHPELNVTNATFEWEPTKIDEISLGAVATEGSQPGSTVYIGFEFVVLVELNPAYAMSTVAHELLGHATYDEGGSNFQAALYGKSQTIDPSLPSGEETYEYWPSEIYSLLREYPYWTKVADSDQSKRLALPGGAKRPQRINYDPRDAIRGLLRQMKDRWDPALHVPLARGYVQRLRVDPHIDPAALKEFEACVRAVFASSADRILQ